MAKEEKSLEKVATCEEKSLEKYGKTRKSPLKKVVIWKTIIFEKESEEEKMLKKEYLLRGKNLRNSSY